MKTKYCLFLLSFALILTLIVAFVPPGRTQCINSHYKLLDTERMSSSSVVYDPSQREELYGTDNMAQYLLDLHDNQATFNFCGGLFFQLVLTEKLREHFMQSNQPRVSKEPVMSRIPGYTQDNSADNTLIFHGREIRNVPNAAGGMGLVLQLSLDKNDPQGWTLTEQNEYNGWKHDASRTWRNAEQLEDLGLVGFKSLYGKDSYTLHHRFYFHTDNAGRLWLSAEDGCEGTPQEAPRKSLFGLF